MNYPIGRSRPDIVSYFMSIADAAASRSTCWHRQQGVVLARGNYIISMGYNGSPPKQPHCIDLGNCAKEQGLPCRAEGLHGESNALLSAARNGVLTLDADCYCIYSPCRSCCNMLKAAGIKSVIYSQLYDSFPSGPDYLQELSIEVYHY
jgi:dCMP deaminase